jgi:hypothetical protein
MRLIKLGLASFAVVCLACVPTGGGSGGGGAGGAGACCSLSGSGVTACSCDPVGGLASCVSTTTVTASIVSSCGNATATGCPALSSCCPNLPASEDPTECVEVANNGTDMACSTSLSMYQLAGYCPPDAGSLFSSLACERGVAGATSTCGTALSGDPCNAPGEQLVPSCPTTALIGCCSKGAGDTAAYVCFYGNAAALDYSMACTEGAGTWSATLP